MHTPISDIHDAVWNAARRCTDPAWDLTVQASWAATGQAPLTDCLALWAQSMEGHPGQAHMYDAIALIGASAPRSIIQHSLWCAAAHLMLVI